MDQPSEIDAKVQELLKDARSANRIDNERAELFSGMVKTKAWQEYVMLLEAKLQGLSDDLLSPAGSVDRMIALEYVKGAMSGLVIARDLPSVTILAMQSLRSERRSATSEPADEDSEDA